MALPFAFRGMSRNLRALSNEALTANLKSLKFREDRVLVDILEHIQEFEYRKLFLPLGYPTLYSYLTGELKYTESEAYRRIEASRFLKTNPGIKSLVNDGQLNLTSISEVRAAVRSYEKNRNQRMTPREQVNLARSVINCSKKETQVRLAQALPEYRPVEYERKQELVDGGIQITMRLTKPQRQKTEKSKDLLASSGPVKSTSALLERLCDFFLGKRDLARAESTRGLNSRIETPQKESAPQLRNYIPVHLRRTIFKRDGGRCQFKAQDGRICGSTYDIEIDHVIPVSHGGKNEPENLRCLCRAHNQWKADRVLN